MYTFYPLTNGKCYYLPICSTSGRYLVSLTCDEGRGAAYGGHGPPYIFNNYFYILQLNCIRMFYKIYIRRWSLQLI